MRSDAPSFHWTDASSEAKRARNSLRRDFRIGLKRPETPHDLSEADPAKAAELYPHEHFQCGVCGTGPWHISWGGICPNCSGAD